MKTILLLILLAIIPSQVFGIIPDVEYYKFNTKLDTDNNKLIVDVDFKVINKEQDSTYTFLFNSESIIQDILLTMENETTTLSFKQTDDNTLTIYIPQTDTAYITMQYSIKINPMSNGEIVFKRENKWYPFNYDDIAYFSSSTELYDTYIVIGQKEPPTLSTSYPLLFIPKESFIHTTQDCKNIQIDYYFSSEDSATINKIKNQVCSSFIFYNNYIGEYKFKTLSFVELSDFKAAQSLSSLIMFGSMFLKYYDYEGWSGWPSHELAHQWIGNSVFIKREKTVGRAFIEESLTEYLKKMYVEKEFGSDSLLSQLSYDSTIYHPIANSDKDVSLIKINQCYPTEKAKVAYRKGPIVHHKLRKMIGDQKWEKLIKKIYSEYYGKIFSFNDFHAIISELGGDSTIIERFEKDVSTTGFEFLKE